MGIWGRLGNVLKSYINDGVERVLGEERPWQSQGDDDFNAAYEELDEFLKGGNKGRDADGSEKRHYEQRRSVPADLKRDFAELGLSPEASEEECKEAYKKLLKIHHPDRHGGDPELMKKATEKSARINAAYDRLEIWFKSRSI